MHQSAPRNVLFDQDGPVAIWFKLRSIIVSVILILCRCQGKSVGILSWKWFEARSAAAVAKAETEHYHHLQRQAMASTVDASQVGTDGYLMLGDLRKKECFHVSQIDTILSRMHAQRAKPLPV